MSKTKTELPEAEINHLISALNRANAAMKQFYEASGVPTHAIGNHFAVIEIGRHPFFAEKIRRGGRFVETRPSAVAIETREDTHNGW